MSTRSNSCPQCGKIWPLELYICPECKTALPQVTRSPEFVLPLLRKRTAYRLGRGLVDSLLLLSILGGVIVVVAAAAGTFQQFGALGTWIVILLTLAGVVQVLVSREILVGILDISDAHLASLDLRIFSPANAEK